MSVREDAKVPQDNGVTFCYFTEHNPFERIKGTKVTGSNSINSTRRKYDKDVIRLKYDEDKNKKTDKKELEGEDRE